MLVVDELLDYLRSREQRALILGSGFLARVGGGGRLLPVPFCGRPARNLV